MVLDPTIPLQIEGYTVFPLALPPLPSFPHDTTCYLYIAPHQPKIPTPTASRSLFLVNVPIDATELHIKNLVSAQIGLPAGRIENIQFEDQRRKSESTIGESSTNATIEKKNKKRKRGNEGPGSHVLQGVQYPPLWDRDLQIDGHTAVVMFVDRASMDAALKAVKSMTKEGNRPIWGEGLEGKVPALGYQRYLKHHQLMYPSETELLDSVNKFHIALAAEETSNARLLAKQRQEPDEDGFVTVTRGGRTNPVKQEAAQENLEKQKQKQKGLEDFYRFQSREKKKQRASELIKKFEEDREKVKKMKEKRGRFKPE